MRKQSNQSGFGVVEVLIIIAVVAILGLAGFFVWNKSHSSKTSSSNASQQSSTKETTSSGSSNAKSDSLTITEWNVKVAVPAELKGATYVIKGDVAQIDSFAQDAVTTCGTQLNPKTAWGIQRYAMGKVTGVDGSAISDADAEKNTSFIHVGDYFYKRVYPTVGCEAATDQIAAIDMAQASLFKSLEKE